jgi:1-deoxy-D-xylulose-5-phosphate synthase
MKNNKMYLDSIHSPSDLKKLSISELNKFSSEVRQVLLKKLSDHGGHIGPNLGVVELTVALHYVFDSPKDKIVYDVSHQSYIHKMLTGRAEAFLNAEKYDDISGYSNPKESEHDHFKIGHTSTSVSLACGLAKARDLKGDHENIIALIGDGSLSGGEAYEGLNNAAEAETNLIIVVNDNEMSIGENHGGLYQNLRQLRDSNGTASCNFFKAIGLNYLYIEDGHDIDALVKTLGSVKDTDHPTVVHVHTVKGKGYKPAETNKEAYHSGAPFDLESGEYKFSRTKGIIDLTAEYLLKAMGKDPTVVAVNAGTAGFFGFNKERREKAGKQFVDVGIAEEHAVAYSSGIAAGGGKPVFCVASTFVQRTYDQISQDLCINNNSALILVSGGSVYAMNDVSHLGIFDIAMMGNIPNLVYLAPTCEKEYLKMLEWGIKQDQHPVAIRIPVIQVAADEVSYSTDYAQLNKYKVTKKGKKVAIVALGDFYGIGKDVVGGLAKDQSIKATLINPRFITGIDENLLNSLLEDHSLVITLEDGILEGGFGEKIASFYGPTNMKVKNYGIKKSFPDRYVPEKLLEENGVTVKQILQNISAILKTE